ncbi:MAG: hypothetical protein Fues2KO_37460 [Fuerstiella sp.]
MFGTVTVHAVQQTQVVYLLTQAGKQFADRQSALTGWPEAVDRTTGLWIERFLSTRPAFHVQKDYPFGRGGVVRFSRCQWIRRRVRTIAMRGCFLCQQGPESQRRKTGCR